MSISELVEIVESEGRGVRSYTECARVCQERINDKPDQAASYYLLKIAANRFVDAYDDQPLTSQAADREFSAFKGYADELFAVEEESDPAKKLTAINKVAALIANHKYLRSEV